MLDQNVLRCDSAGRTTRHRCAIVLITGGLLLAPLIMFEAGCQKQTNLVDLEVATAETKEPDQNHFDAAIDFLKMRDEHSLDRSANQASYHLNRWIRDEAADPRWMIDRPLINSLPDEIRRAGHQRDPLGQSVGRLRLSLERCAADRTGTLAPRHRQTGCVA